MNKIAATGAFIMAGSIALGALGAHALETKLNPDQLDAYDTASFYLIIHALSLIILSTTPLSDKVKSRSRWSFLIGMLFFSGSIYFLTTSHLFQLESFNKVIGPITPIGGLILIGSWLYVAFSFINNRDSNEK